MKESIDAIMFREANRFEKARLTLGTSGPGDMVVRTLVTAISPGTERWILRGKHIGTTFPCVPGYHRIGIVESVGPAVRDFDEGDIVYGSGNRWEEPVASMWGAHVSRSVSAPDGYTFLSSARPNAFELDTLAFTILAGVAHRGIGALDVRRGERLLIVGGGIIGICAAQLAALAGAHPVILEPDDARRALIQSLGIETTDSGAADRDERLQCQAPDGFDILYDTVGHAATTDAMVPRIRPAGRILLQAQYFDKAACAIDLDAIKIREITVKTTIGIDGRDFAGTAAHIRARRLRIGPLITHRFAAPGDMEEGYRLLDRGGAFNLGIVFRWD